MPTTHSPSQNHLLAALPQAEFARLSPHLELVPMPLGEVLYESGGRLQHVYFPTTSIVSLLYVLEDGASAEIAVVGNEGILGISLFMGGETTPSRAVVQSAGHGYRLKAQLLKQEFNRAGPMLHLLLRYTQALITQMTQTAVCNRHHSVRAAALPLAAVEPGPAVVELADDDAGADRQHARRAPRGRHRGRRQPAACRPDPLQPRSHRRAGPARPGGAVCECYAVVKREFDRLLSDIPRGDPLHVLGESDT